MASLFQRDKSVISRHISNLFNEGELQPAGTVAKSATVQIEGGKEVTRSLEFYNLDVIISVGYRVKSQRAPQFRIWATQRLREYIVKGFVLDDERLKNPDQPFDYFEELTRRIQDIRTSERRFFQTVQNKVHWAITGQTAAEIIHARVDAAKPNLGLTSADAIHASV